MIDSLLTFGAKSVKPEILEKTLTVRAETVNEIENNCVNKTLNSSTWQSLIIAPRGAGKTHIIRVIYYRLKNNKKISRKSVIAYMSEDEVGIANFTDLMISILRAFIKYNEAGSEILESQISEASLIKDSNKREIFVKSILIKFVDKRIIILLIENFDKILLTLGLQGQSSLRDFIHQYNNLSIIATSQNLIASLQNSKNPFYNFFNVLLLKKLNLEETVKFLETIAETEKDQALIEEMKKPSFEGKLRTIYELTEGNHRLLVTFFSFLKAEFKTELSLIFIKVMNDLKPYYEQFINPLPPQQQKIVKHLSLTRRAMAGKEISRECFIEPNVFSKQISLLYEKGMIDKNKSGKDVFYELKEPLMRICFEISENPDGISRLFVAFLKTYYDRSILRKQYLKFRYGAKFQNEDIKNKYENEAIMYSMALSKQEKEKILFANKVFEKINNYAELDNILQSPETNILKQIDLAFKNFDNNQYDKALENLKKSIKISPDNDKVYFAMGLTYGKLGKHKDALENIHKAIDINPNDAKFFINMGIAFNNLEQFEEAIKSFHKAIEINPKDKTIFYNMGKVLYNLKQFKEAIKSYQKAIKIKPDDKAYFDMGNAFYKLKQFKEAIKSYQKAIKIKPDSKVYYNLGLSFSKLEQYKEAIKSCQEAIKIKPDFEAYYNLGLSFSKLEQYKEAIKSYQNAIKIKPDFKAYYNLGLSFSKLEQYENTIKSFQKAIEIKPDDEQTYNRMGVTFFKLEQYEKAIRILQKSIKINPNNDLIYIYMGLIFSQLEQHEETIKSFQKVIEKKPNDDIAYFNIGSALYKLERYEEALKSFQKVIEIKPDFEAYYNLGLSFSKLKYYEDAMKSYQKAIEIKPDFEAYYNLGLSFSKLEQYKEAIKSYQKAIEIKPTEDAVYNNLGLIYLITNRIDNAFEIFHKGLGVNPDNKSINFSLLGAYVRVNDQNKSKELMNNLIKNVKNDLLTISLTEDIFYNLFRFGSDEFIKSYFKFLLKLILKEKKNNQLWNSLPESLFSILINIEDYDKERLNKIENALNELLNEYEESIIPIKMFKVGVAYLKNKDKNAIFNLSKEERKLFNEAVIDKRK